MPRTRVLSRTLSAALAAAALAAPAAIAQPIDNGPMPPATPQQDMRSPETQDAAATPAPRGLPSFPTYPPAPAKSARPAASDDGGSGFPTAGVGIAGLVLVGGLAGIGATACRRAARPRARLIP